MNCKYIHLNACRPPPSPNAHIYDESFMDIYIVLLCIHLYFTLEYYTRTASLLLGSHNIFMLKSCYMRSGIYAVKRRVNLLGVSCA